MNTTLQELMSAFHIRLLQVASYTETLKWAEDSSVLEGFHLNLEYFYTAKLIVEGSKPI